MCIFYKACLSPVTITVALLMLVTSTSIRAETLPQPSYARFIHSYKVPNVNVVTQNGQKAQLSAILDHSKPVIVNFIFTTCNAICPIMTAILSKVHATIGPSSPNLRFVSISIDPEHDTPTTLAEYAKKFKAGANWQFLTGELAEMQQIQKAFDAYRGDKMNHTSLTLMRSANSNTWVRIEGNTTAHELIREYESLKLM